MGTTKKLVAVLEIENCMDCPHHEVIADPDPDDSFCMDDCAVICKQAIDTEKVDFSSRHAADHSIYRKTAVACRPYNLRNESDVPEWCPLLKKKKKGKQ